MSNTIEVRFPNLNKNCTILENDAEIKKGSNINKCEIKKRIRVHTAVFECLGDELMSDVNDSLYENIGGAQSDDERLDHVEDFTEILNDPKLLEIFRDTCYTFVVEVTNIDNGDTFYVNTEGHKYARYVGRAAI